jgi:hypothetical protein
VPGLPVLFDDVAAPGAAAGLEATLAGLLAGAGPHAADVLEPDRLMPPAADLLPGRSQPAHPPGGAAGGSVPAPAALAALALAAAGARRRRPAPPGRRRRA